MLAMLNRLVVKCKRCPSGHFLLEDQEMHFRENCRALRYYRCSAPGCDSMQRFASFEEIRDQHWRKDCEMCFRKCSACDSIYKNEVHNCVKNLIEKLQNLELEDKFYEEEE